MIRGLLLDFSGTAVDEDDEVIETISQRIAADRRVRSPAEVAGMWGQAFAAATAATLDDGFRPQRGLARGARAQVLDDLGSDLDAELKTQPDLVPRLLERGSQHANALADATQVEVREAIGMRYW